MSFIVFIPYREAEYNYDGWPDRVIGDGYIEAEFKCTSDDAGEIAIYRAWDGEEYRFVGRDETEWTVDVRED